MKSIKSLVAVFFIFMSTGCSDTARIIAEDIKDDPQNFLSIGLYQATIRAEDAVLNRRQNAPTVCAMGANAKINSHIEYGAITSERVRHLNDIEVLRLMLIERNNCKEGSPESKILIDEINRRGIASTREIIKADMGKPMGLREPILRALFNREPRTRKAKEGYKDYKVLDYSTSDVCRHDYILNNGIVVGFQYKICDRKNSKGYEKRIGVDV